MSLGIFSHVHCQFQPPPIFMLYFRRYVYNPAWEKKLSTTIDPVQFKFAVGSIEVFAVVLLWISKSKKIRSVAGELVYT